jgi:hypothetical protein
MARKKATDRPRDKRGRFMSSKKAPKKNPARKTPRPRGETERRPPVDADPRVSWKLQLMKMAQDHGWAAVAGVLSNEARTRALFLEQQHKKIGPTSTEQGLIRDFKRAAGIFAWAYWQLRPMGLK